MQPSSRRPHGSAEEKEAEAGDDNGSPIEQVALTVPVGDDPSTPVLTFRMWVLGTASCALLSFLNQFFWYRKEPLTITAISAQIAVVPLGRLMAAALPARAVLRGTRWEFSLNPGPFSVKEHVLVTIFANSGAGTVYAIHVITAVRVFYGKHITFFVSLLVVLTTQVGRKAGARGMRVCSARLASATVCVCVVTYVLCAPRCWGSAGREYSGGTWWSRRRCGGRLTSCRSPSSGTPQLPNRFWPICALYEYFNFGAEGIRLFCTSSLYLLFFMF